MHIVFEGQNTIYRENVIDVVAHRLRNRGEKVLITRQPGTSYDMCCASLHDVMKKNNFNPDAKMLLCLADALQHDKSVVRPFLSSKNGTILQNKGIVAALINFVKSESDPVAAVIRQRVFDAVYNYLNPVDLLVFCMSQYPGPGSGKISLRKDSRVTYRSIHKNPASLFPLIGTVMEHLLYVSVNFASEVPLAADLVLKNIDDLRRK